MGTADMLVVRTSSLGVYTGNHSCPCPSKALGNLAIQDVDSSSKWQLAGAVSSLPVSLGDDMVPLHLQRGLTTQPRELWATRTASRAASWPWSWSGLREGCVVCPSGSMVVTLALGTVVST